MLTNPKLRDSYYYLYLTPEDIPEELHCAICTEVYITPLQSKKCLHPFCEKCILPSIERSPTCPMCRAHIRRPELVPSENIEQELRNLQVRCPVPGDCEWQGSRGDLEQHLELECISVLLLCGANRLFKDCPESFVRAELLAHQKDCPYQLTPCKLDCQKLFKNSESMEDHCTNECPERIVSCPLCNETYQSRLAEKHILVCLEALVPCKNQSVLGTFGGCPKSVPRSLMTKHLSTECVWEPVKEPLQAVQSYLLSIEQRIAQLEMHQQQEISRLSTLSLSIGDIKSSSHLEEIIRFNPAIQILQLRGFQSGTAWAEITLVLENDTRIKMLDLHGSVIEKAGAVLLAKVIRKNMCLERLVLTENQIGDQGVDFIAKALQANPVVYWLNLDKCGIDEKGAQSLAKAIQAGLVHLSLSWNLLKSRGMELIAQALGDSRCVLQELNLAHNEIGLKGAEALAVAMGSNKSLQTLNLNLNRIGSKGAVELANCLKENTTLSFLALADNSIDNVGAIALSNMLKANTALMTLDLEGNRIQDEGAEELMQALEQSAMKMRVCRTLYVCHNQISKEGVQKLEQVAESVHVHDSSLNR